eukprot:scaffold6927_cov93-Cylindrotheca_fusiformis.AAC.8
MASYRSILDNPSRGQAKKGLLHLPLSTRSSVASIPKKSISTIVPISVAHALRNDAVQHLSTPAGQSHTFSDPFIAQAYIEVMAKRLRDNTDNTVVPESISGAEKKGRRPPSEHRSLNGTASLSTSPKSGVESDSESASHARRNPPHGNCKDEKWNDLFNLLAAFKEEHGHCRVPQHYTPNIYLSQWVKRQRYYRKHKSGLMSEQRIQKLDKLGFVWDAQEHFWKTRFKELKTYKLMHGHCNVPCKYPPNQKMATWVKCQRRQYKLRTLGMPSSLSEHRISLLEELGFVWKIRGLYTCTKSKG